MSVGVFESQFADDGTVDSLVNLADGIDTISTTLAEDLDAISEDFIKLVDPGAAPNAGVIKVDEELIYYDGRYSRAVTRTDDISKKLYDLTRGPSRVAHYAGAPVTIYFPPRYGNPAIKESLIAVETALLARPTGSGTLNAIPKWTASSILGNSRFYDDGTDISAQSTSLVSLGDVGALGNSTKLVVDDAGRVISLLAQGSSLAINGNSGDVSVVVSNNAWISIDNASHSMDLGDIDGWGHSTFIAIEDDDQQIRLAGNAGIKVLNPIVPSTAGSTTAGSNALPFSSFYVGNAATNNIRLTGTSTAARTVTFPDATGTVVLSGSSGTTNALPKWTSSTVLGDSRFHDDGTTAYFGASGACAVAVDTGQIVLTSNFPSGSVSTTGFGLLVEIIGQATLGDFSLTGNGTFLEVDDVVHQRVTLSSEVRFSGYLTAGFVKTNSSGIISIDSATYLTGNQTITLSGDISGSGATSITTTIGANKVTLGMHATLAANSVIGNSTGSSATPTAVTIASANTASAIVIRDGSGNFSAGIITAALTGNASTATALQNARTIGGVSFDGTVNITVASATGGFTASGGDLALGANNLTMTGSIGATGARITKLWAADITVTNAIAGSVTGNAGTATALQTGRTINGTTFDGTGNITVTAAAGTLTGTTLNATVVTSSLTSVGTLASLTTILSDGGTNTAATVVTIGHNTSGTAADGFGSITKWQLQDSTTASTEAGDITTTWATAAHATRKARTVFNIDDTSVREAFRVEASGTAAMIGFLGATAVVRQTGDAGTALVTLGLMSGTPTFGAANISGTTLAAGVVTSSLTTVGIIGAGTWQGGVINSTYGGMGVNNGGRTLTLNTNSGTIAFSAASKTVTFAKTLTFDGTDSTTMTFPTTSATIARTDAANTFTGHQTIEGVTSTGATGTGKFVFDTSPTFATQITSPKVVNTGGVAIQGTNTNDAAASTYIGEEISATAATNSVALTAATAKTITSISLTAGDWSVSCIAYYRNPGANVEIATSISATNNTLDITVGRFYDGSATTFGGDQSQTVGPYRISLSTTTTIYLVGSSANGCNSGGWISARRMR